MEIRKVELINLQEALEVYKSCVCQHKKEGFNQWDEHYPSKLVVEKDIKNGWLFGGFLNQKLIALVAITEDEPMEYKAVKWTNSNRYKVVHRLCVHERFLRKGMAKEMMSFAELYSKRNHFSAIRLDTFSLNHGALKFYEKIGYLKVGFVNFEKRIDSNYTCFEKKL